MTNPVTPELSGELSRAQWRKAARSGSNGGCVEFADLGHHVALRDSKDPDGPKLVFTPFEWECFLDGAAKGEFTQ